MTLTIEAARVAQMADDDLLIRCEGLTVSAVDYAGDAVLVSLTGGRGYARGSACTVHVHNELDQPLFERLTIRIPHDPTARALAGQIERVERWCKRGTPLQFCAAPGRLAWLAESRSCWVALPLAL